MHKIVHDYLGLAFTPIRRFNTLSIFLNVLSNDIFINRLIFNNYYFYQLIIN